jgi:hypothetical protein
LLDAEARVLLSRERAVPSVSEIKQGHVQDEHRIMTASGTPKNSRQPGPRFGLGLFEFHFLILCPKTLANFATRYHEAVEGFFGASQGRADSTSFEGGNKSGMTAQPC